MNIDWGFLVFTLMTLLIGFGVGVAFILRGTASEKEIGHEDRWSMPYEISCIRQSTDDEEILRLVADWQEMRRLLELAYSVLHIGPEDAKGFRREIKRVLTATGDW